MGPPSPPSPGSTNCMSESVGHCHDCAKKGEAALFPAHLLLLYQRDHMGVTGEACEWDMAKCEYNQ